MLVKFEFVSEDGSTSSFSREVEAVPRIGEHFADYDDGQPMPAFCAGKVVRVEHNGDGSQSPLQIKVFVDQRED